MIGACTAMTALAVPPEVPPDLVFLTKTQLTWPAVAGAVGYDVYSSPTAPDGFQCIDRTTSTTAFVTATPAHVAMYLVSAHDAAGQEGTLGFESGGLERTPDLRCLDTDADGLIDIQDNCPAIANLDQADQDLNGVGDRCDPRTYHFESDPIGTRPADTTQLGGTNGTWLVSDFAGDRGVRYGALGASVVDSFTRLALDLPRQSFDFYLDTRETGTGRVIVELWHDGAPGMRAGRAVRFALGLGTVRLESRRADLTTLIAEQPYSDNGRVRVRVRRGGGNSRLFQIDRWNGAGWDLNQAALTLPDIEPYFGRSVGVAEWSDGGAALTRITLRPAYDGADFELVPNLTGVTGWKLFQRSSSGTADLPVDFQYRSPEPVRIELAIESSSGAPLLGFDFADQRTDLAATPNGSWSRVIVPAVPQGGPYTLRARLVASDDAQILGTDVIGSLAVGDLFLAAGQSNMAGYSGSLTPTETPIDSVHLFGNDYRWKRAIEPMDDGVDQVDRVSEEAPAHSVMMRFGKELQAVLGVPIGVIPAPLGGTNLFAQWQRSATNPFDRGTLYGSSIHRVMLHQQAAPIRGAIWYQGESDAGRGVTNYLNDLRQLVLNWRTDLAAPQLFFGNYQLSNCQTNDFETWIPIQEAQRLYALEDANSMVVGLNDLTRSDTIHLDVASYKTAGRRLALATLARSYAQPQTLGPVRTALRFQGTSRSRIEVVFDKPIQGGIVQSFRVYEGNNQVTISNLTTSGNSVVLQLSRNVNTSNTFVTYGTSHAPGGSSWVTAVDGSGTALAFYRNQVQ